MNRNQKDVLAIQESITANTPQVCWCGAELEATDDKKCTDCLAQEQELIDWYYALMRTEERDFDDDYYSEDYLDYHYGFDEDYE